MFNAMTPIILKKGESHYFDNYFEFGFYFFVSGDVQIKMIPRQSLNKEVEGAEGSISASQV